MKHSTNWLLIADGARARIVAMEGPPSARRFIEVEEFSGDHDPNRELGRDRPARVHESQGEHRHAIEPKVDRSREQKRDFAAHIADAIDAHLRASRFERLTVVASPVTLGDLRDAFSDAVRARISHEIDKDLTRIPNADLEKSLSDTPFFS